MSNYFSFLNRNERALLKSYNLVVKTHTNRVCAYAEKLLNDADFAKDITQEAYIKLWENRAKIDLKNAKPWLFTTIYRLCMDHFRKKNLLVLNSDEIQETSNIPQEFDLKDILEEALNRLSHVQKSIIMLRDYEGYDYKKISEIMELSEAQVKVYLFRARKKLKQFIRNPETVI